MLSLCQISGLLSMGPTCKVTKLFNQLERRFLTFGVPKLSETLNFWWIKTPHQSITRVQQDASIFSQIAICRTCHAHRQLGIANLFGVRIKTAAFVRFNGENKANRWPSAPSKWPPPSVHMTFYSNQWHIVREGGLHGRKVHYHSAKKVKSLWWDRSTRSGCKTGNRPTVLHSWLSTRVALLR